MYQSMRAMCRKRYRDETKFAKIVHVRHDVRTTLKLSTRACLTAVGGRTVGLCEAFGSFERRREKGMMRLRVRLRSVQIHNSSFTLTAGTPSLNPKLRSLSASYPPKLRLRGGG